MFGSRLVVARIECLLHVDRSGSDRSIIWVTGAYVAGALDGVPVVISDRGYEQNRLGEYAGYGAAGRSFLWRSLQISPDRIVIFRDTLVRAFGNDPERLSAEVKRTVRHEVAHHLGFDERGVGDLGL